MYVLITNWCFYVIEMNYQQYIFTDAGFCVNSTVVINLTV